MPRVQFNEPDPLPGGMWWWASPGLMGSAVPALCATDVPELQGQWQPWFPLANTMLFLLGNPEELLKISSVSDRIMLLFQRLRELAWT